MEAEAQRNKETERGMFMGLAYYPCCCLLLDISWYMDSLHI